MAYKDAALLVLSLLTVLLAACMPLNPEENGIGRYTATVTGGLDTTVAGRAFHYAGNQREGFKYVIRLEAPNAPANMGIHLFTPAQPQIGTYRIRMRDGTELKTGQAFAGIQLTNGNSFLGSAGEIRITSATPLRGTFKFLGENNQLGVSDAQVTGSFQFD